MPAPRVYSTEAIILRHQDLGEADRIITVFTPRFGKLRVVAKGVKRPRSRLAGHLDSLCEVNLLLARGRNLDIVTQAQVADQFLALRRSLSRIAQGLYAAELVNCFMADNMAHPAVYHLLQATLAHLATPSPNPLVLRRFEMRLLEEIGYRPQLQQCLACGDDNVGADCYFSPSGGGILCSGCRATEATVRPLSSGALRLLRSLQKGEGVRPATSGEVVAEVEAVLRQYLLHLSERELHAATFIDVLRREAASVG